MTSPESLPDLYDSEFFRGLSAQSRASAAAIVPVILRLLPARSVLDVGCGTGAWAEAFIRHGIEDTIGVDGSWVNKQDLLIDPGRFVCCDLEEPLDLDRRFDLVVALEVAEHLAPEAAQTFIETLTRHGDIVIFSAAVPGQGGTNHLNEQWPSYWTRRFRACGYSAFDLLRPEIWDDRRANFWFRQNLVVYVSEAIATRASVFSGVRAPLDIVHPELFEARSPSLREIPPIRVSLRHLAAGVRRRLTRMRDRFERQRPSKPHKP